MGACCGKESKTQKEQREKEERAEARRQYREQQRQQKQAPQESFSAVVPPPDQQRNDHALHRTDGAGPTTSVEMADRNRSDSLIQSATMDIVDVDVSDYAISKPRSAPARPVPETSISGWITKQGGRVKTWKRRYATLIGDTFSYYEDKGLPPDKALGRIYVKDVIAVQDPSDVIDEQDEKHISDKKKGKKKKQKEKKYTDKHKFRVVTPDRTFKLCAETERELRDWVQGFRIRMQRLNPHLR